MLEIAPDVWQLPLAPRFAINAYAIGDVVVDAGLKGSAKKVLGQLHGRRIAAHALTHAHPDHAGGSKQVCDTLGVPCWASACDAPAVHLEPAIVGFDHGPALTDAAPKLRAFVEGL